MRSLFCQSIWDCMRSGPDYGLKTRCARAVEVDRALRARCYHGGEAAKWKHRAAERSIHLLSLDQLGELGKKVTGIVRTRCRFRMILHAEDRQFAMTHALDGAVIQVDVGDFHLLRQ